MKHDKKNENVKRHDLIKRDDVESNIIRKIIDLDFFLNEISRTIYNAERTNDIFLQICLKKNFWNKITMIRMLIISNTKKC
jgi:hypothetical protein